MASSGKRARSLGRLLEAAGAALGPPPPRPGRESIDAVGLTSEVLDVYRGLGGIQDEPRIAPGAWDFGLEGVVLELDEREHFNRYRALTLDSPAYARLDEFDVDMYRGFCAEHEGECQSYGGYWTNPSAEAEFGPAGEPGELDRGSGSPRWKQRAFYDFVKDLAPLTEGLVVSRLAIWEEITAGPETILVGDLLDRAAHEDLAGAGWPAVVLTRVKQQALRETADQPKEQTGN